MKESEILKATLHFAKTGEISDDLIRFFDQTGRWHGDRRSWRHAVYATAKFRMRHARLPFARRTRRSRARLHLLTSFFWKENATAMIPYCEVAGSIIIAQNVDVVAPNLRALGGHFYAKTTLTIGLPYLRKVGGDFDVVATWRLHAPRLQHVAGKLQVQDFGLPALETVGGRLWMYWTKVARAPRLRSVGGSLYAHVASVFEAPRLQFVGGHFEVSDLTRRVAVPELEHVGGNFLAEGAEYLAAHRLRKVGFVLDTRSARDFHRTDLKFGVTWLIHPEAVERRRMRQAVRKLLREQTSMEI